jgi:membrane protein YqaA with SNARE-associated domain
MPAIGVYRSDTLTTEPNNKRASRWLDRLRNSPHGLWLLGAMSFLETIIVPIPIEVVLIPYMLVNRARIWIIASVTMAGCLVGALVGYGIGVVAFESVGQWFIASFGHDASFESVRAYFYQYGFIAIIVIGVLPIPFQLAMLLAGITGYSLPLFVLATVLARGVRYYGLAWLVCRFGDRAIAVFRQHAVLASVTATAFVSVLFFAGHYVADSLL